MLVLIIMIPYIVLPTKILENKKLSTMEKILISLLGVLTDKGNQVAKVTDGYIADNLFVSRVHVNRMLAKLKSAGIISIDKVYGQREITLLRTDLIYKFKKKELNE